MSGYELNRPPDPPASPPPSEPRLSLLDDDADQPCPSCGKPLPPGTVVCMACGYNMAGSSKVRTSIGEEEEPAAIEPIVREKGMTQKAATILGVVLLVAAVAMAAWFTKEGTSFGVRLERCVLVLVQAVTSVGTGLVAVWFAAWLLQRPFGKVDLAAARLFAAIAAFLLVFNIVIPIPFLAIGVLMKLAAAAGVYWLAVMLLIGKDPKTTHHIVLAHAAASLVLFIQTWLWSGTFESVMW